MSARIGNFLLGPPANLLLYLFFAASYLAVFMWLHLAALVLPRVRRETAFQVINSWFYASFLAGMRWVLVGMRLRIAPELRRLRGAVVMANHLSFFDTILMMALFRRQKTIVKGVMFRVPFMGWAQNGAGYLPSQAGTPFQKVLLARLAGLREFFAAGGCLFVFPEGTRSRDGRLGSFHTGAFHIAAHAGVPVELLLIRNTHLVQPPGKLFVRPFPGPEVSLEHLARLDPPADHLRSSVQAMAEQAEAIYRQRLGHSAHR
ncbi:MAG: lysophospholipid acyltransferase family protein [Pseudomonadota bacterium]